MKNNQLLSKFWKHKSSNYFIKKTLSCLIRKVKLLLTFPLTNFELSKNFEWTLFPSFVFHYSPIYFLWKFSFYSENSFQAFNFVEANSNNVCS